MIDVQSVRKHLDLLGYETTYNPKTNIIVASLKTNKFYIFYYNVFVDHYPDKETLINDIVINMNRSIIRDL